MLSDVSGLRSGRVGYPVGMDIGDELRTAGLTVITGREGIGRTTRVTGIDARITGTGKAHEGADDLNVIVSPARAVAYIERDGRVWLLADGPVEDADAAVVFLAAHRDGDINDVQSEALSVLEAVLGAAYALDARTDAPDAGNGKSDPDPINQEGDS